MKTLYDLLDEYLEYLESLNYSSMTINGKYYSCVNFIKYLESSFQIGTANGVRKSHLFTWQKHLDGVRTREGTPLKPGALNKRIEGVRSFFKHLALKGYVLRNLIDAVAYVKEPKMLPSGIMTNMQTSKVLRQPDTNTLLGYRDRTVMELMYSSGLRAGEVISMHTGSVDFKNGTVKVMGKGKKERVVPVGKTALRYLETYLKAVRPFQLVKGNKKSFFINRRGEEFQYRPLLDMVRKYCDLAKIDIHVTPHSFRRTCATELIRGNANIYHVKEILGHESLETLRHYAKLTITDLRKTHAKCHPRERNS
jgi:integrase/recombinase XerD